MALANIPDQTHTFKGQEYVFVDQLEDYLAELECPICNNIVNEPLQTSCGHLFCKKCYHRVKRAQCPVCNQVHTATPDNFNERKVKNLKVRCLNHNEGCEWVGSLGEELQHRTKQDGCRYETMECPNGCGETIKRTTRQDHFIKCPNRPYTCEHCEEEGPYQDIVGKHLDTCSQYPVLCPNGCEEKIPRERAESQTKPLKEEIAKLKTGLQAEEERVHKLEEANTAKEKQITALRGEIRAKAQRADGLEQETKKQAATINQLEGDARAKTACIAELERDTQAKTRRTTQLEGNIQAKTKHITQLEREVQAKTRHITQLEGEVQAKTRRITQMEGEAQAMVARIDQLERDTKAKSKSITRLKIFAFILILIVFALLFFCWNR